MAIAACATSTRIRNDPGAITKPVNTLCLDCHDDFAKVMARKSTHEAARVNCISCHNPHNSRYPKLLVEESERLVPQLPYGHQQPGDQRQGET